MNKGEVKTHVHNPYRFIECKRTKQDWNTFLKSQNYPLSWGFRELKLAWAFQGLMGKPISSFTQDHDYIPYVYEPYLTDTGLPLKASLINSEKNPMGFYYNSKIKGHWAIVKLGSKNCTLSKQEKSLLLKHGHYIRNKKELIIDLENAVQIAGKSDSSNFRIITRISDKNDIFSALCQLFEIPDSETDYYPRNALRYAFTNNGALNEPAKEWLDNWVEDTSLKTHLSCFMEQKRGFRDTRDIYLTCHYLKSWNVHLENGDNFPYGLAALSYLNGTNCLIGWEWEHGDLVESKALIQVKKD